MKKKTAAILSAFMLMQGFLPALAAGGIPDHCGTPITGFEIGTSSLSESVKQYIPLFEKAGNQYGVDPNLLAAICMQESSGRNLSYRDDGTPYPAWGIMQIEYTLEDAFADFGERTTGERWTLEDRLDPEKAVPFAAWLISQALYRYDSDYLKMIQSYNFGETVLNRIIEDKGDDWLNYRADAASYVQNWSYDTYGDPEYIEHVLQYFHEDITYNGVKVRINGELVRFEDQASIVVDGTTIVPIRAISQMFGANVEWDGDNYCAIISSGNSSLTIPINSTTAYIDGEPVSIGAAAEILNGRTMVPLRFIAETFGITVDWDADTRTVLIET